MADETPNDEIKKDESAELVLAHAEQKKAEAEVLEAQAKLHKAQQPLIDKIILRGVIPIALAVIGPWALWKFNRAEEKREEQGKVVLELRNLLDKAIEERRQRVAENTKWRERLAKIEESRAVELKSMSTMVQRLDEVVKVGVIQMAIMQAIRAQEDERAAGAGAARRHEVKIDPKRLRRDVTTQVRLPGVKRKLISEEIRRALDRRSKR